MRTHANLTAIANSHYHPVKAKSDWKLYYGDGKSCLYGPASYQYCMAEIKRQMGYNPRLKKELFKIK